MARIGAPGRPCICGRGALRLLVAAMWVGLVSAPAAYGQEADELIEGELIADGARPAVQVLGEGGFVYQGDTDLDAGGSLEVFRYDLGVAGRLHLMDRLRWGNTFFFGVNDYNFGDGANAWNTIFNMRFGSKLTYAVNEQWGVSAGGLFMFSPENGANWGDSITGGGLVAGEYRHSDTLFASVGVAILSQIEDDTTVAPQVDLLWLPAQFWTFRLGGVPATGGAAASGELAYQIAEPVDLGLGVLYQQRRFRLNDSGPVPEGVGVDNSLPIRLRLGWNVNQHFAVNLLAGVVLAGELEIEDRDGREVSSTDYDPSAYVGLRVAGGF